MIAWGGWSAIWCAIFMTLATGSTSFAAAKPISIAESASKLSPVMKIRAAR